MTCDYINKNYFLTRNLAQECWNSVHLSFTLIISVPFLIFWMAVFPIVFLCYLRSNHQSIEMSRSNEIITTFIAGYKNENYYWEFILMARKFLMILTTTFLRNDPEFALYILLTIASFSFLLQVLYLPYETTIYQYNNLEILSLNACFLGFLLAIFYLRSESPIVENIVFVFIMISNALFLILWVAKYLVILKGRIRQVIANMAKDERGSFISKAMSPLINRFSKFFPNKKNSDFQNKPLNHANIRNIYFNRSTNNSSFPSNLGAFRLAEVNEEKIEES